MKNNGYPKYFKNKGDDIYASYDGVNWFWYANLGCCQKVRLNNMSKLRVWWIPQVGADGGAFYVPVDTVEEGKKIMDLLAAYDAFQLQNKIKPDYCSTGGIQIWNEDESEWEDWWMETDEDYFDDVDDYCEQYEKADELKDFRSELFKQIDWNKIHEIIMYKEIAISF